MRIASAALSKFRAAPLAEKRRTVGCLALLGLFSVSHLAHLRQRYRLLLSQSSAVRFDSCSGGDGILVRFVIAAPLPLPAELLQEQLEHGDFIIMQREEDMCRGKSFAYLSYVARAGWGGSPPAFILKADMVTFILADNLANSLRALLVVPAPLKYYGRGWGMVEDPIEARYFASPGVVFGMLYGMSFDLAAATALAAEAAGAANSNAVVGLEDWMMTFFASTAIKALHLNVHWLSDPLLCVLILSAHWLAPPLA